MTATSDSAQRHCHVERAAGAGSPKRVGPIAPGRRLRATLLKAAGAAAFVLPVIGTGATASAIAPATEGVYFGVAGDVATAQERTGASLADHSYGYFEGAVPTGHMITVRFREFVTWKATAALSAGTSRYQDVARWADTLKNRPGVTMVAFHHEPETSGNTTFGTAADFKAAFRKVVDVFRARGVTNVAFTWQMTEYAFRARPDAYNYAGTWYPGNGYVDVVGADPYNWYTCGHGRGKWLSLQTLTEPVVSFARARGKQVALAEFATVRDARRPDWIRRGGDYLAANDDIIVAAFYFDHAPTNSANADCTWPLSSDADYSAIGYVAARLGSLG